MNHTADLETAAQAALDATARTGETQWAVLQVEISACDLLAAFEASESRERFYWRRAIARSFWLRRGDRGRGRESICGDFGTGRAPFRASAYFW